MTTTATKAAVAVITTNDLLPDSAVLLTRRPTTMKCHPGQWVFPGGKAEPADGGDLRATALREASEELGVPAGAITPITEWVPIHEPVTGTSVTAVFAQVTAGPATELDISGSTEIIDHCWVPLAELADHGQQVAASAEEGPRSPGFVFENRAGNPVIAFGFTGTIIRRILGDIAAVQRATDDPNPRFPAPLEITNFGDDVLPIDLKAGDTIDTATTTRLTRRELQQLATLTAYSIERLEATRHKVLELGVTGPEQQDLLKVLGEQIISTQLLENKIRLMSF